MPPDSRLSNGIRLVDVHQPRCVLPRPAPSVVTSGHSIGIILFSDILFSRIVAEQEASTPRPDDVLDTEKRL